MATTGRFERGEWYQQRNGEPWDDRNRFSLWTCNFSKCQTKERIGCFRIWDTVLLFEDANGDW
jgi:hypothetical protein